jgi:DNA-binding SARP family transcriptional activator
VKSPSLLWGRLDAVPAPELSGWPRASARQVRGILQFGLLGSLVVRNAAAEPVNVGGVQPRTVLAVLLAAEGRVVTSDALVDAVWGDRPPASASGTLQSHMSRLRRSLNGGQAALIFEPPGYRLDVVPDEVDFRRFEALADDGRRLLTAGHPSEARAALVEGLNLWRGSALAEFEDRPFASGLAARLEDLRLAALEDRLAADLALGRHAAVIGELNELVMAHPLGEPLRARLALALYRSGRQADALRAIQAARQTLVEELGVDPGRTLQDLEAAILNHDLGLELAGPPLNPLASWVAAPPLPAPSPPAGPSGSLVGRMVEVSELLGVLDQAAVVTRTVIIEGEPGIGKTRLAEDIETGEETGEDSRGIPGRDQHAGTDPDAGCDRCGGGEHGERIQGHLLFGWQRQAVYAAIAAARLARCEQPVQHPHGAVADCLCGDCSGPHRGGIGQLADLGAGNTNTHVHILLGRVRVRYPS